MCVCAAGDFANKASDALVHADNEGAPPLLPARYRLECAVGPRVEHCREGARHEARPQRASADSQGSARRGRGGGRVEEDVAARRRGRRCAPLGGSLEPECCARFVSGAGVVTL